MNEFVYVVVWGDFNEENHLFTNDRWTQYIFRSLERAQAYVRGCLVHSAEAFDDDEICIPDISDIRVDVEYECYNEHLGYDYVKIRQYYLM